MKCLWSLLQILLLTYDYYVRCTTHVGTYLLSRGWWCWQWQKHGYCWWWEGWWLWNPGHSFPCEFLQGADIRSPVDNVWGNNCMGERMSGVVNRRVNKCPLPAKFTGERMSGWTNVRIPWLWFWLPTDLDSVVSRQPLLAGSLGGVTAGVGLRLQLEVAVERTGWSQFVQEWLTCSTKAVFFHFLPSKALYITSHDAFFISWLVDLSGQIIGKTTLSCINNTR